MAAMLINNGLALTQHDGKNTVPADAYMVAALVLLKVPL